MDSTGDDFQRAVLLLCGGLMFLDIDIQNSSVPINQVYISVKRSVASFCMGG